MGKPIQFERNESKVKANCNRAIFADFCTDCLGADCGRIAQKIAKNTKDGGIPSGCAGRRDEDSKFATFAAFCADGLGADSGRVRRRSQKVTKKKPNELVAVCDR